MFSFVGIIEPEVKHGQEHSKKNCMQVVYYTTFYQMERRTGKKGGRPLDSLHLQWYQSNHNYIIMASPACGKQTLNTYSIGGHKSFPCCSCYRCIWMAAKSWFVRPPSMHGTMLGRNSFIVTVDAGKPSIILLHIEDNGPSWKIEACLQ